jgi:hypothetical protein
MSEEYKPLCSERNCKSKGEARLGIHQLSDFFWQCDNCYQERKQMWQLTHRLIDWDYRQTINNLDEALNYFAFLQKGRKYGAFIKTGSIQGSAGNIAHICSIRTDELDPFRNYWPKYYNYIVCYNRAFLVGHAAIRFFERVPKHFASVDWQSVHSKILEQALELRKKVHGCRIVIVMQSKEVFYVNPQILDKFSFEYETYHTLPREWEATTSIPITKLEREDPFFIKSS